MLKTNGICPKKYSVIKIIRNWKQIQKNESPLKNYYIITVSSTLKENQNHWNAKK